MTSNHIHDESKVLTRATNQHLENGAVHFAVDLDLERKVLRKIDAFLLPMLSFLLLVAFLDRTNIGNARIQGLEKDLNMHDNQYNVALFIFFVPYMILDVPANICMKKLRPSRYLPTLMFCWGVVTIGAGMTRSFAGLVVCRVFLGAFEAGFFPGAIYLLSMYYTRYELQKRLAIYYTASIISQAFGGLIAYAIAHMDGVGNYAAWRWIFIFEGLLTIFTAIVAFFILPDWPEQSKHLRPEETQILLAKLARDTQEYREKKSYAKVLKECAKDPKVHFSGLMYFGTAITGSASAYFLPSILLQFGWTSVEAQYMSIPVWVVASVVTIIIGIISDKVKVRWIFAVGPLSLSVCGYAILLAQKHVSVAVRYTAIYFIISGNFAAITVSLTWINNNVVGSKRRGMSTAILLGFGNIGSITGSLVYLSWEAPYYHTGYGISLAGHLLTITSAIGYFTYCRYENRTKEAGERDHLLSLPKDEVDALGDKHPLYRYTY